MLIKDSILTVALWIGKTDIMEEFSRSWTRREWSFALILSHTLLFICLAFFFFFLFLWIHATLRHERVCILSGFFSSFLSYMLNFLPRSDRVTFPEQLAHLHVDSTFYLFDVFTYLGDLEIDFWLQLILIQILDFYWEIALNINLFI